MSQADEVGLDPNPPAVDPEFEKLLNETYEVADEMRPKDFDFINEMVDRLELVKKGKVAGFTPNMVAWIEDLHRRHVQNTED